MGSPTHNDPGELRNGLRSDTATVTDSAKERLRSEVVDQPRQNAQAPKGGATRSQGQQTVAPAQS